MDGQQALDRHASSPSLCNWKHGECGATATPSPFKRRPERAAFPFDQGNM